MRFPGTLAPTWLSQPPLGNGIKPSDSALLSACQGLRLHTGPVGDYLQVPLGRVQNSLAAHSIVSEASQGWAFSS